MLHAHSGGPGQGCPRASRPMNALLPLLLVVLGTDTAAECRDDRVTIKGGFGEAHFTVQIATDAAERAQGLMNVPEMGTLEGTLFTYDEPRTVSFWMHNTLIPLDMIFAGPDGIIIAIHENAVPLDRTSIPSEGVQFALEINGGLAGRLGIKLGHALQHPAIGRGAALPCE
jgi:uncharacterized membrane protein (UPF0127 family)